jgi:hypothetical protein
LDFHPEAVSVELYTKKKINLYNGRETIHKIIQKTQKTQNKNQSMPNKKIYGWNGDNITLIFNVGARWRRCVKLMHPADLPPGGIYPSVR